MSTKALGKQFSINSDGKIEKREIPRDASHKIRQRKSKKISVVRRNKWARKTT